MKPLRGPAGIHTDDEGTGLVLIHTDSSARQDARDIFFSLVSESERREDRGMQGTGPPPARKFRTSPFSSSV